MKTVLKPGLTVEIKKSMVGEGPIPIYDVAIVAIKESWIETYGSRELLKAFLRGFEARAVMVGGEYLPRPEIPREEESGVTADDD